jgi:serine protease Do
MKQPKRFTWLVGLVLLSLVAMTGCSALAMPQSGVVNAAIATATPTPAPAITADSSTVDALAALQSRLEGLYEQVSPAVVNIQVVGQAEAVSSVIPEIPGFPFNPPVPQEPPVQRGLGSGFVWDKEGHIVTNNHVVDGADKITVVFADGMTVPAEIVGTDADSDLAVVKVDVPAEQLQPVQMADSTQVKVGQLAVAIGNPFGLEGTMTVGFVSAVGRSLPVESGDMQGLRYTIPDVIQTDAPINPGNSGGVLINDQGHVIGVTAAIESPVRANAGIGFAIPAAIVQKVVPTLIETGHYEHTWLGISGTSLNPDLAQAMELEADQRGVLVVDVTPDSPADKAALQGSDRQVEIEGQQVRVGGDVIVAIDEQPIKEFDDLVAYLARNTQVGQTVDLTVLRDGKEETVKVTLAARPQQQVQRSQPEQGAGSGVWLGIQGLTLTPEIAQAMDLDADQQGMLVAQVVQGSPADEAGLHGSSKSAVINGQQVMIGGDVIVAADGQSVAGMEDLLGFMQGAEPSQKVTLTLLRDGRQVEVTVTLAERPAENR